MDQPDRGAERHFAQPYRQMVTMLLVLGLVGAGAYLAYPQVAPVFLANPYLNGFIAFVFVIGVLACFWQVFQLVSSVSWIEGFAHDRPGHQFTKAPRLVASLAALLRKKGARNQLGASSSRSILDSVATRIDEARDITRYIVNLLIFLGLLGTFYGLATTVPAVVDTIRSLAPTEGDSGMAVFERLMSGLEDQLEGMGIAFASSLLGLAGSLVVGLLELFASHGQNRFYRELEEWLSTITRVGFTGEEGWRNRSPVPWHNWLNTWPSGWTRCRRSTLNRPRGAMRRTTRWGNWPRRSGRCRSRLAVAAVPRWRAWPKARSGFPPLWKGWPARARVVSMRKAGCGCGRWMCRCCVFWKRFPPVVRKASASCGPTFAQLTKAVRLMGRRGSDGL